MWQTTIILIKGGTKCWAAGIDSIFIVFGGHIFQQTVCILMGIYCVPIPAECFLFSEEAVFMQGYPPRKENNVA